MACLALRIIFLSTKHDKKYVHDSNLCVFPFIYLVSSFDIDLSDSNSTLSRKEIQRIQGISSHGQRNFFYLVSGFDVKPTLG